MIKIFLEDKIISLSFRLGRNQGIRFNTEYRIGDQIIYLPLACGKQKLSKERLKNYGQKGKIIKFLEGKFKIETFENYYFWAIPFDCLPLKK